MPTRLLRDWTSSETVNSLEPAAEVFFTRLIMKVDDYGRHSANPRLLNSICFPLRADVSDSAIEQWLNACAGAGLITIYEVGGKRYLEIQKFGQRVRTESKCPSNDGQMTVICAQERLSTRTNDRLGGGVCEGGGGKAPANDSAEIPTVEEVVANGAISGIPEPYCREFFDGREWFDERGRLRKWKPNMIRFWHEDRVKPRWKNGTGIPEQRQSGAFRSKRDAL